ncbi:MAG TPA: hypothetical protein VHU14_01620 [Solirubrobacterales bacterium]|jgi:hypothetical protein|nr:hypothetical protein [Solirubrobacterales bacterium]
MFRYFLSIKAFIVLLAALAVAGCGSSGSGEVTVQATSISKAEFAKRAEAVCAAAHRSFLADLEKFERTHKFPEEKSPYETVWLSELANQVVFPNLEPEVVEISEIGAPVSDVAAVSKFLNALQQRLEEVRAVSRELNKTPTPFKRAANLAKASGLKGCRENLV